MAIKRICVFSLVLICLIGNFRSEAQYSFVIDTAVHYQRMDGFGGALTWYCDRITSSSKKNEIINLIVNDLGADIVRLKNWYYPLGYPGVKSTATMQVSWFKQHFDATNQLHALIKAANPEIKFLLSSWGPPPSLKSNNSLYEGTLKKDVNGNYMYGGLGTYWRDILNNITFSPDYISLQNEPGYVNPGWETCKFMPVETDTLAGFEEMFNHVYDSIKFNAPLPKFLGPEIENISRTSWDTTLNKFREFTAPIKNHIGLYGYAYHLYNYYGRPYNIDSLRLNIIKYEFNNKPNFMTEFSSTNFNWHHTADIIHETITKANAAAYIYWELMWDQNSTAMIKVDNTGNYTIGSHYHTIKHYSKYIDEGYTRIAGLGGDNLVKLTAFMNPEKTQVSIIAMNCDSSSSHTMNLNFPGLNISETTLGAAYRSTEGNFFYDIMGDIKIDSSITLPKQSLFTFVINIAPVTGVKRYQGQIKTLACSPNPFKDEVSLSLPDNTSECKFFLKDDMGREVESYILKPGQKLLIGKNLIPGVYYVIPENGTSLKSLKIIKQ